MKLRFKEKYLIVLVILCFISVGFYYSYAIFVTKQLQENVVAIKVNDNRVTLDIDNKEPKMFIKSKSSMDFRINLRNNQDMNYFYVVLVKGLKAGVKVSSNDETKGEIKSLDKKELLIHANNTSNDDVQLEFIVKVSNSDILDKEIGYYYINDVDSFDHSNANKPVLEGLNLLPVNYKRINSQEGVWYKTDETNQTNIWYSYENGVWANAVLLSDENYHKYKNKKIGTTIETSDILGFYVWIPRFKYYIINSSNYTNYERMTNVIFEDDSESTGTVECIDRIGNLSDKHIFSEVCKDNYYQHIYDNLSTYTHPSFKDKTGFWVSKFLMGEGEKSIPNNSIMKKNITDASIISNKNIHSHVLTNMEYGAIILLSNSSYGKTANPMYYSDDNNTFTRIYANTYEYEITGCSSEYSMHSKGIITDLSKKCINYNDLEDYSHISNSINYPIGYAGAGASSTGNITGVYDLASISGEIVAGFMVDSDGNLPFVTNYYDSYSYNSYIGKISSSSNIHNLYRYKFGDAIKEHFRSFNEFGMWHSGKLIQNKDTGIIVRGGDASVYSASVEDINYVAPFRLALHKQ